MPSINDAIKRNADRITAGGQTGTGVGPESVKTPDTPIVSAVGPILDLPTGFPQRGMLDADTSGTADRNDSNRGFTSGAVRSRAYPFSAQPVQNNTTIVQQAAATPAPTPTPLAIQVNGAPTPVQKLIDLIAGTGITLTPDLSGGIKIDGSTGFTNLALGDANAIWPQSDPASIIYKDDFPCGPTAQPGATLPGIGEENWTTIIHDNTLTMSAVAAPYDGALYMQTTGIASQGTVLTLGALSTIGASMIGGYPLLGTTGWVANFVFKWPAFIDTTPTSNVFTKTRLYLGFGQYPSGPANFTQGRPMNFVGLRFDTDTGAPSIGDTTYHFEIVQKTSYGNAQGTAVDTGLAPDFKWHRFTMRSVVLGQVLFSIDGGTETKISVGAQSQNITDVQGFANGCLQVSGMSNCTACPGSLATIAGFTGGTYSQCNGTWTVSDYSTLSLLQLETSLGVIAFGTAGSPTISYFNAFSPVIAFGNDSQAAPATKALLVDYFDFVANPALATDFAQTVDATKPRYYAAQT